MPERESNSKISKYSISHKDFATYKKELWEHVQFYKSLGFNMLPLKFKEKKPRMKWEKELKLQERKATDKELEKWFKNKLVNVAVVCGKVSNNLTVIDFDSVSLFHRFFEKAEELLKSTMAVRTSRGVHVYFQTPTPVKTTKIHDDEEREVITIKGEGSYVVAPPSIHPSGKQYKFLCKKPPMYVEEDLRQRIIDRAEELGLKVPREIVDIGEILKGVPEGNRDNSLVRLIHWLKKKGKLKEEILQLCLKWNERNKPPLPKEYVEYKVEYHCGMDKIYNYNFKQKPEKYDITPELELKQVTPEPVEIRINELRAELYGRFVKFRGQIAGISMAKAIPHKIIIDCSQCGTEEIDLKDPNNWSYLQEFLFKRKQLIKTLKQMHAHSEAPYEERRATIDFSKEYIDFFILSIRPILEYQKFTEETYRAIPVYLVGQRVPGEKEAEFEGIVVTDERDNLTVLVYTATPIEEKFDVQFTLQDHLLFKKYFSKSSIEEEINKTIATHIVGRRIAKVAAALTAHSPLYLNFEGRRILGIIKTCFLGDSTTGKSETSESLKRDFNIGDFVGGEMSKTTGLMATVDNDKKMIIWGVIPLADKELVVIDGLQKVSTDDMNKMREALRKGYIDVIKSVRGRAPCRTRIIATANPAKPNIEESYTYLCEAIRDCWPFRDPVNITRWDLFVPFSSKDVPPDEIAESEARLPKIPPEIFQKHVLWAWNLKPEDIVFTKEALEAIRDAFVDLRRYHVPDLPLVHNGHKEVIARVAASYAILTHSVVLTDFNSSEPPSELTEFNTLTDFADTKFLHQADGSSKNIPPEKTVKLLKSVKVVICKKHVDWAKDFIFRLLKLWQYPEYSAFVKGLRGLSEDEIEEIDEMLEEDLTLKQIFVEIIKRPGIEASTLAEKLNITKQWVSKKVAKLKSYDLVESQERKKGYWPTPKGITYAKKRITGERPDKKKETSRITVKCKNCGYEWEVEEDVVPETLKCPACGAKGAEVTP